MEAHSFPCPACKQDVAADAPPGTLLRCPHCERPIRMPRSKHRDERLDVFRAIDPANRKATNAMLCSIVGLVCCPFVGLVGIIMALRVPTASTDDADERRLIKRRRGIAIGIGILSIVVYSVVGVLVYPSLRQGARDVRVDRDERGCKAKITKLANILQDQYFGVSVPPTSLDQLIDAGLITRDDTGVVIDGKRYDFQYVPQFNQSQFINQVILFDHPQTHRDGGGHVVHATFEVQYLSKTDFLAEISSLTMPDGSTLDIETLKEPVDIEDATND